MTFTPTWWRRVDSNHRSETQQIYSLPPLATRELLHIELWSWWTDSNPDLLITNQLLYRLSYTSVSRVLSNSRCYSNRESESCQ